jgi:hypothetical protein
MDEWTNDEEEDKNEDAIVNVDISVLRETIAAKTSIPPFLHAFKISYSEYLLMDENCLFRISHAITKSHVHMACFAMQREYRNMLDTSERRNELASLVSTIIQSTREFKRDSQMPSVLMIGYQISLNPAIVLLPSYPLCATHCDVVIPRKGKKDVFNQKVDKTLSKAQFRREVYISQLEDASNVVVDDMQRVIAYDKKLSSMTKLPTLTKTVVIEKDPDGQTAKVSHKGVKRRNYAYVYIGNASAIYAARTFYQSMCQHLATKSYTPNGEELPVSPDVAFAIAGGYERIYITVPRMQRTGAHQIANVILNFYMELPGKMFIFDMRLLEHCDLDHVIQVCFPKQVRDRSLVLRMLGDIKTTTAVFPLLFLCPYVNDYPRIFVSHDKTGNIPMEITTIFKESFAWEVSEFHNRNNNSHSNNDDDE